MNIEIKTPLTVEDVEKLKAGDFVYITGKIYTARDAAHKRMTEELKKGKEIPIPLEGNIIYYMGPTPAREHQVIGSAGPTTSGRMDAFTPLLLEKGLKGMIGKGERSKKVIEAIKENKSVYFAAVGGAGALLAQHIKNVQIIAYEDLGTEAIRELTVDKLPSIVVIDSQGNNLYETEKTKYRAL
jgi:fumarate hydratase subunit beta